MVCAKLHRLEDLGLAMLHQGSPGLLALAKLSSLTRLNLQNAEALSGDVLVPLAAALPNIRKLYLAGCSNVGDDCVDALSKCRQLEDLNVRDTGITEAGLERLGAAFGATLMVTR